MAITYKSQGSGVSTESSGAALSPLCPATVDAGDILIAHVFWEGTTTAPSTPATWDLLSGPHVIETTIGRHWVFGKIAAGSEDGSAVAFGGPAVTTQRAARVYSFAGRVGGTILELVTGFTPTSNANDPQMPTVSTTINGALAVALIAQNDNNTFANPTGESGGDWVEAVAEYTANLTPGLSLGIVTCTPTGNPGTVTGGADNTTNDPVGVVGFEIKQSNNKNITAGLGALDLAGLAPTVSVTNNKVVTPGVGAIDIAGLAPTVFATNHKNITPDVGGITFSGFAPTVQIGINVSPGVGVVTFTGIEPTVAVSDHKNVSPSTGEITFEGFSPTVELPKTVSTSTGEIALTGFEPIVSVSDHKNITPGTGEIVFEGYAPTIGAGTSVSPGTGQITFSGFEPTIQTPRSVVTSTGELILTGFNPSVTVTNNVNPGYGELVFEGFAPAISTFGGPVLAEPGTGVFVFNGFAPTVVGLRKQYLVRKSKMANDGSKISRIRNESHKSEIGTAEGHSKIDDGI